MDRAWDTSSMNISFSDGSASSNRSMSIPASRYDLSILSGVLPSSMAYSTTPGRGTSFRSLARSSGMPRACTCTELAPCCRLISARSPNSSRRPSAISATRSHNSSTSDMTCVLNMIVAPGALPLQQHLFHQLDVQRVQT